jgi:hypothetical protein
VSELADVLRAALLAHRSGICVLPPREDGSKAPDSDSWTERQRVRPTEDQIRRTYANGRTGHGFVCGGVSGGLELLDFDERSLYGEFADRMREAGLAELLERIERSYLEHTPNGVHLFYRCAEPKNSKLARRAKEVGEQKDPADKIKTLIETKGEGGYAVVAPSHGRVHESGQPYVLVAGGPESIVSITTEEHADLLRVARTFDQIHQPRSESERRRASRGNGQSRPGDDFNARTTWREVLEPHGWVLVFNRGEQAYWRRPGKAEGISATTNHGGSDRLAVFSTSTLFEDVLESRATYDRFGAYAVLSHRGDLEAAARDLRARGYGQAGPVPGSGSNRIAAADGLPEIPISGRQLESVVGDAVRALVARNDPARLFMRSGALVRVGRDETGEPRIEAVGEVALLEELSRAARWVRRDSEGKTRDAHPSRALAGVVLAALVRGDGVLPPLRGLVESPVVGRDGSIFERPGYDPSSRLFYAPEPGFSLPRVPEAATQAEFAGAVEILAELFADFPFRAQADHATAYAVLFTAALRTIIDGQVPAFLVDAPAPGTGKTLLAKAVGAVATGRVPTMMSPPGDRDDSEWRKRITSALLDGGSLAIIDNIEEPLSSAALASALTSDRWTDRLLGRSEMVTLPARIIWVVTGNNLRLRGDLPRRSVWCRLDAKVARPWKREGFQHEDLLGWVRKHRGDLLAAVFTIARSWVAAGRPGPGTEVPKLGGFEPWRQVVGGMLHLAGVPRFLGNLDELYDAADDETPAWAAFLAAWGQECPEPATAAELTQAIKQGGRLHDALPPDLADALETAKSFSRRLGKALSRRVETRFPAEGGRTARVVRAGASGRVILWKVVTE